MNKPMNISSKCETKTKSINSRKRQHSQQKNDTKINTANYLRNAVCRISMTTHLKSSNCIS